MKRTNVLRATTDVTNPIMDLIMQHIKDDGMFFKFQTPTQVNLYRTRQDKFMDNRLAFINLDTWTATISGAKRDTKEWMLNFLSVLERKLNANFRPMKPMEFTLEVLNRGL